MANSKRQPQQQRLPKKISELIDDANTEPEREYPAVVADLGPVIQILKAKKFSWKEMSEWFAARGASYSPGSLAGGLKKWEREQNKKADDSGEGE